jgi:uroporphyrinogen-III synthase
MRTALVTRPREDSEGVARELSARGFAVAIEPLLDIVSLDVAVETEGVQGILATSANGIRALARACPERSLPVWAVGDASARVARELGYASVESAGGDVETLAALVIERCTPQTGAFLHAAGTVTAGDLAGRLGEAGFTLRRIVLYEAKTATEISASLAERLRSDGVDVALFFSPRTAATFATLVRAAGLDGSTARIEAFALSPAVAAELASLSWARIHVAAAPTQAALLAALDETKMTEMDTPPAQPETPAPEPEKGETVPVEEKTSYRGAIIMAVLMVVLAVAGVLGWSEWKHRTAPGPVETAPAPVAQAPNEMDELRAELAATRERLRQMEERLAQAPAASGAAPVLAPVENRLSQTEAAIRALQAQPQIPARVTEQLDALDKQVADLKRTSADAAAVLRLADRVEKVEAGFRDMQARRSSASAQLLAVGQLREALAKAMPFDAELRSLKALAGQDAEMEAALETLKSRAVTGIPTFPVLASRFTALSPVIVRADVLPTEQNWWRKTLDRLASLITIEREDGNTAGSSPSAIVARAQAALAQDDLAGAVAELDALQGGPADQAANWLADARARLAADKAVSELTAHVVAAIGAGQ